MLAFYVLAEDFNWGFFGLLIPYVLFVVIEATVSNQNKKESLIKDGKITLNVTPLEIIGMLLGICLVMIVVAGIIFYNNSMGNITSSVSLNDIGYDSIDSMGVDSSSRDSLDMSFYAIDSTGTASSKSSSLDSFDNLFDRAKSNSINNLEIAEEAIVEYNNNVEEPTETEKVTKVRNVFLESLAFIPELVVNNGKANTEIQISDNITTWNIQTIGNTKEGNVGYATAEFKVFKDYFVDFSLPANAVVGDKVSIPVTVYNYTEDSLSVQIQAIENDWCVIGNYINDIDVDAKSTKMVYVPIEITKEGNHIFRVETKAGNKADIVERNLTVKIDGLETQKMVSSGIITDNYSMDILFDDTFIEGTEKLKLRIFPTAAVQTIDNIEAMLKLPTGCFEQTSSSLYPDILVLKYLKENSLENEELRTKALEYISEGYQKLLTYEVPGIKGGYSLYGYSPAEPVITAFGLMEFNELKEVYDVDEKIINNMIEYLFSNQNLDGTFDYSSTYIGGTSSTSKLAMNAYICWALSEVCPEDARLKNSIKYLEDNISKEEDNYTLALIANVLVNTKRDTSSVIKDLMDEIVVTDTGSYINSKIRDYYGSYGIYQRIQTTALTSLALSKLNKDTKNNTELINYLISAKYSGGTWGTTQDTILALKAINEVSANADISEQVLTINLNGESNSIEIKDDFLDVYEMEFDNVSKENKLSIGMKKGKLIYEVIKEYYVDYAELEENDTIDLSYEMTENAKVNEEVIQTINITNHTDSTIDNGLLTINIPQGTSVIEDSLLELKYKGIIEKYEYNYNTINIYFRNVVREKEYTLDIHYRALYPEEITGGAMRFYDYYNPNIEAFTTPTKLIVNE